MFLYGFKGKRVTRAELERSAMVTCLEPEFARRLLGAMQECADAGHEIGIGGTIRSTATQRAGFLRSHVVYFDGPIPKSCRGCVLDGVRYVLKPHTAHKALPGGSCHERLTAPFPEVVTAADMVGKDRALFATKYAPRWGLTNFGKVNGEIWHIQPADLPLSRSKFRPAMFPLKRWPREEDDMQMVRIKNADGSPADPNVWAVTGTMIERFTDGPDDETWFRFTGASAPKDFPRSLLPRYRLIGESGHIPRTEFARTAG